MLRALKTVTFLYVPQEDRIAGAINAGHPDAWSCWLTRRLALAVLERATGYIANTSNLAQRAPAELRGEAIAFEREAAIAKTAPAMSQTPPEILKSSAAAAELAERLTISREQDAFRLELRGEAIAFEPRPPSPRPRRRCRRRRRRFSNRAPPPPNSPTG